MRLRFPFRSLRTGLLLTYLLLIAASVGLLAWRIGSSLDASRFAETQRDQEGRTILMAGASEELLEKLNANEIGPEELEGEALTLARQVSQRVVIFDLSGKVLVDSEHNENHRDESKLPEVAAALEGRVARDIRYDPDDQMDALFTAAPIRHGKDLIGAVRLELPMNLVREASTQFWIRIIGAALLAALLTAAVSLWFAKALADPIAAITRAASAMARGDLKQRVRASGPDELQQLARSFNSMAERVSAVMEDQRGFVANAAHELRTPLTTIQLRAEALAEGAKDDPALASHFLADISNETSRLSRLVDELLDLSRIETGLITPRRESISLGAIARGAAEELAPRAVEAGIEIDVDVAENLPRVNADPDQIRQVFLNLLGNALKFTPSGGTVQARSQVVRQAQSSDRLGAGVWLLSKVIDSGVGIPAEDLSRVFDRFYRSDKARTRDPGSNGGAGLGLAIVKSIVDQHGGRVWAQSEIGKGTEITFALPLRDARRRDLT